MAFLPRGTSWPTWQWWTHLSATEQAAWAAVWIGCLVGLLAAAGGFAAAWASFKAARAAVAVARMPIDQQETYRLAKARVVATAIATELGLARDQTQLAARMVKSQVLESDAIAQAAQSFRVDRTATLERFFDRFDVFGLEEGIIVANAASAALNFNSHIEALKRNLVNNFLMILRGQSHVQREKDEFLAACAATCDVIQQGIDVLAKHGAKV